MPENPTNQLFLGRNSSLRICHLEIWSNFNFLHNSQLIAFPPSHAWSFFALVCCVYYGNYCKSFVPVLTVFFTQVWVTASLLSSAANSSVFLPHTSQIMSRISAGYFSNVPRTGTILVPYRYLIYDQLPSFSICCIVSHMKEIKSNKHFHFYITWNI